MGSQAWKVELGPVGKGLLHLRVAVGAVELRKRNADRAVCPLDRDGPLNLSNDSYLLAGGVRSGLETQEVRPAGQPGRIKLRPLPLPVTRGAPVQGGHALPEGVVERDGGLRLLLDGEREGCCAGHGIGCWGCQPHGLLRLDLGIAKTAIEILCEDTSEVKISTPISFVTTSVRPSFN